MPKPEGQSWPPAKDPELDMLAQDAMAVFQEHYGGPLTPTYGEEAAAYYRKKVHAEETAESDEAS